MRLPSLEITQITSPDGVKNGELAPDASGESKLHGSFPRGDNEGGEWTDGYR